MQAGQKKPAVSYQEDKTDLFSQHLQVQILTGQVAVYAVEKEKHYSEKKSAYFVYFPDNKEKPPPYYSSFFLVGPAGTKAVKLHVKNHAFKDPALTWLNEKWVFGRIWVKECLALEFVLDLETGQLIQKTVAYFSAETE